MTEGSDDDRDPGSDDTGSSESTNGVPGGRPVDGPLGPADDDTDEDGSGDADETASDGDAPDGSGDASDGAPADGTASDEREELDDDRGEAGDDRGEAGDDRGEAGDDDTQSLNEGADSLDEAAAAAPNESNGDADDGQPPEAYRIDEPDMSSHWPDEEIGDDETSNGERSDDQASAEASEEADDETSNGETSDDETSAEASEEADDDSGELGDGSRSVPDHSSGPQEASYGSALSGPEEVGGERVDPEEARQTRETAGSNDESEVVSESALQPDEDVSVHENPGPGGASEPPEGSEPREAGDPPGPGEDRLGPAPEEAQRDGPEAVTDGAPAQPTTPTGPADDEGQTAAEAGMAAAGGTAGETADEPLSGPESDEEMPLTEHIEEMMRRLAAVVGVGGVVTMAVLLAGIGIELVPSSEDIIVFLWDHHVDFAEHKPYVYGPLEFLLTKLKVAGLSGVIVALPVFVYQTYRFMRPGLYPHERRYYLAAVPTSLILALVGVAFAHFVVLPAIFQYFISYTEASAQLAFGLRETFNLILLLMGYMAVVFQIPLFIQLAIMMGLVTRRWLEQRRLLFWGSFLGISFVVSPDPTGMSPIIVTVTMIALFEGTLALLRWTGN